MVTLATGYELASRVTFHSHMEFLMKCHYPVVVAKFREVVVSPGNSAHRLVYPSLTVSGDSSIHQQLMLSLSSVLANPLLCVAHVLTPLSTHLIYYDT